ncbi:MAG: ABC transporter substrate-binding protein [bacterium]|nr:ABC transporter substrate-binding protein [bacterium]
MKRREFIGKTLAAGAGLSSIYWKIKEETVRVGYLPITDATPLLIAHARDYYKDEGLKVEQPSLIRSWSALVESFLTGKFDVVHLLLPIPIWMRYRNKYPVKIVAWNHLNGSALTVGANTGINDFSQLGGRRIAVPYWYSMHNVILQLGLRAVGLKPVIKAQSEALKKDEVNLFLLPPPEMPSILRSGKIDGYIVAEPFNAIGELKINARIMRFTGDIWKNHPCCVVVMKEKMLKEKPVVAQKIVNAVVRAQHWVTGNPGATAGILSREGKGYLPTDKKTLVRVFTGYSPETYGPGKQPQAIKHPQWDVGRIGFQPYPYPSATRYIYDQLKHTLVQGNIGFLQQQTGDFVCKDLVDDRLAKKAIMELGGPAKFKDMNPEAPWQRQEVIEVNNGK